MRCPLLNSVVGSFRFLHKVEVLTTWSSFPAQPISIRKSTIEKIKPINLCAPREFLKKCLPCLIIIQSCYFDYGGFSRRPCWRAETMKQFCMKIDLISQGRENVLFLPSNMTAMTSHANASRRPCWRAKTMKQFCMKIDLISRKCIVFALQRGSNDVTWKCSIE